MNLNNVLVLGGSGFLGTHVCEKLIEQGCRVVVPSRRSERARHLLMLPTLELEQANVHDDAQLRALLQGHDAVVNLVAILHGRSGQPYGPEFRQVHVELPRRLARLAAEAGVRRIVHVSALGADSSGPSMYQRSKGDGEAVLKAQPGIDWTLLRPSVMFGANDRFLNMFARLQKVLPVLALACARAKFQPVWVEDVAQAIVRALLEPASIGQTIECTGPKVYTLRELVRLAGIWSGHPRPIIELPDALGRLQALALECAPGGPLMSRDNLDSMKVDNVASGKLPGLELLGIRPTALEAVGPNYVGRHHPRRRFDAWRASARRF